MEYLQDNGESYVKNALLNASFCFVFAELREKKKINTVNLSAYTKTEFFRQNLYVLFFCKLMYTHFISTSLTYIYIYAQREIKNTIRIQYNIIIRKKNQLTLVCSFNM